MAAAGSLAIAKDYDGSATARIFPLMTSAAIALMGALSLRARPAGGAAEGQAADRAALRGPAAMLMLAFGYLWLMGKIGYLLSTAMAAPAALWIFGIRSPAALAAAAILCPAVYHLVFFELLASFPPVGAWFDPLFLFGY